jgi:TolA-binding protein
MNTLVKGALGLLLILVSIFCLQRFRAGYVHTEMSRPGLSDGEASLVVTNEPATASTNSVTAAVVGTEPTNATSSSAAAVVDTNSPAAAVERAPVVPAPVPPGDRSKAFVWLGGFVGSMLVAAGLLAWEVAQWFSRRTGDVLFAEDAPAETDPDYDAAEAEWTNGNHLEAIALMREHLKKNPRDQYVAIRIAEIYEKDLGNAVAATLELEEVLTKKLSREKWGWTAIHLANLYSGPMNQPPKAIALLERVIAEYPETSAAKKARLRLGVQEEAPAPEEPPQDPDSPQLPKGFSAKKR